MRVVFLSPSLFRKVAPWLWCVLLACSTASAETSNGDTRATALPVVMGPPAKSLDQFFQNPGQWKQTRSLISKLLVADHALSGMYTDEQLKKWLPQLRDWGIELELEVGAIKEWGITAEDVWRRQKPMWDHITRTGGQIASIAMDEPFIAVRYHLKKAGYEKSDEYAVEETAKFIAKVREAYPAMQIGDIEGYPALSVEEVKWWIQALESKLEEMGVKGLDFFRLDVDWSNFEIKNKGNWQEVVEIERFCRSKGITFSLAYWAAGYAYLKKKGIADDTTWYVSVMGQGYRYALAGGRPDEYVVQSWIKQPEKMVPESEYFSFASSVRDLALKIVKPMEGNR